MKKALLTAAAVSTVGTASLVGLSTAAAQTTGDSLVDKLSTRFNLSSDEVQEVFDEHRSERRAEFEEKRTEALQDKVDEGIITQEQLELLQVKVDELQAQKQELRDQDLSREEMREQMEAARTEFEAWASENNIDLDAIRPARGEGQGHRGGMMQRGHGQGFGPSDDAANIEQEL